MALYKLDGHSGEESNDTRMPPIPLYPFFDPAAADRLPFVISDELIKAGDKTVANDVMTRLYLSRFGTPIVTYLHVDRMRHPKPDPVRLPDWRSPIMLLNRYRDSLRPYLRAWPPISESYAVGVVPDMVAAVRAYVDARRAWVDREIDRIVFELDQIQVRKVA